MSDDTPHDPAPSGTTVTEEGPRVSSEEVRDLSRLQRSATERRIGGVCGGLARHLDVDPTLVRVLAGVLVFFGGAGLLLYAGLWLFVPDERSGRAVVHLDGGGRSVALVVVGVLAALALLGGWGGWRIVPLPLPLLVVLGIVVWLVARDRRPTSGPSGTSGVSGVSGTSGTVPRTRVLPAYRPPCRPPRTGPVLFWPTLAVIAIALGALGVYDASGHRVADGAYAALALAITGLTLVLGAFRGRPGGLILLGLLAIVGTASGVVLGTWPHGSAQSYSPGTAAEVAPSYDLDDGELTLDLSDVTDPAALDGRRIHITGRTGLVEVILPKRAGARVDSDIDLAGGITVGGSSGGGLSPHTVRTITAPAGAPVLDLDIDTRLGAIDVRNSYE